MIRWVLVAVLALAAPAFGQTKPIGAFDAAGAPAWVSFGTLDASGDLPAPRPGFGWVAQIGMHDDPRLAAGPIAQAAVDRLTAAGLWGNVIGVTWGEEWYERWFHGYFDRYGLPASHPEGVAILHDWIGRQQAILRAVTGRPVVWVTSRVSASRPVAAASDIVALDAYPADGATFAASVEPVLLEAEALTTVPLVLVPRWFVMTGPFQGAGWRAFSQPPTQDAIDGYARYLARPRWIAMWGFLMGSRPGADLVGLADMPASLSAVEQSLRARGIIR